MEIKINDNQIKDVDTLKITAELQKILDEKFNKAVVITGIKYCIKPNQDKIGYINTSIDIGLL